jgi:hypothetical protein
MSNTPEIVGKYFVGKRRQDYVWGRIVSEQLSNKFLVNFFYWHPGATESDFVPASVTALRMNGWRFFSTTAELNAAVAELSQSLATVAQYDAA